MTVEDAALALKEKLQTISLKEPEQEIQITINKSHAALPVVAEVLDSIKEATITDAWALYMRFIPLRRICSITGFSEDELKQYVYGPDGWKKQRDSLQKEVNEEIKFGQLARLKKLTGVGLSLIENCFEALEVECKQKNMTISLDQASMIAEIFSKLHRAKILEETTEEANKAASLTPEELVGAFVNDPYMQYAIEDAKNQLKEDVLEQEDETEKFTNPNAEPDSLAGIQR